MFERFCAQSVAADQQQRLFAARQQFDDLLDRGFVDLGRCACCRYFDGATAVTPRRIGGEDERGDFARMLARGDDGVAAIFGHRMARSAGADPV